MFYPIEILRVLLIQWVVSQMPKVVLGCTPCFGELRDIVFFTCQSNETVIVQKNGERVNNTGYQDVDAKVEFVPVYQCRMLNVLLNYIGIIFFHWSRWLNHIYCGSLTLQRNLLLLRSSRGGISEEERLGVLNDIWILYCRVIMLLLFKKLLVLLLLSLKLAV